MLVCQKVIIVGLSKQVCNCRPLSETVSATKEWLYSDAVTQERRDNILTGERSLMKREKEILTKWKETKG